MRLNMLWTGTLAGALAMTPPTAGAAGFAASTSGPVTNLTLLGNITPSPTDVNYTVRVYMAASLFNQWFFKAGDGNWVLWTGGPFPAASTALMNGAGTQVSIVRNTDLSALEGTGARVFIGYGRGDTDADAEADMIAGGKYQLIYQFYAAVM